MDNFSLDSFKIDDYGSERRDDFLFPPGDYRARVIRCYEDKFESNGWIGITWVIVDGKCKGKEHFQFMQLNPNPSKDTSEAQLKFGRDMLANVIRAVGFAKPPPHWDHFVGEQALLTLETNTYQGNDRTQIGAVSPDKFHVKTTDSSEPTPAAPADDDGASEDFDDGIPF